MSHQSLPQIKEGSLTRRAGLTFISGLLQQGARFVVGFLVSPIVIRGLGGELYGAMQMIQQTVGYLSLSDMRPMGTLKFTLAVRQHVGDIQEKRRQIGSALLLWTFTFPLFLTIGVFAVWLAPRFIRTAPEFIDSVRLAMAIIIFSVALDRLLSLPANVLRGMNLDYKAMGLNALTVIISGGMSALAIWTGLGLPGVAGASVIGVVITSAARFWVARRALPWFGLAMPKRKEFFEFARLSGWLFLFGLSGILLTASDLLLVGIILGPSSAAVYATTGLVLKMTTEPLAMLISSGAPGIAGLCGQGDWQRVTKIRTEMFVLALGGMAVIGTGVTALNESFLKLWVGDGYYAGHLTNFFLVLVALARMLFRIDTIIVSSMLELRRQALSTCVSGLLVVILGGFLATVWGMSGMAVGSLCGYALQWIYLQFVIQKRIQMSIKPFLNSISVLAWTLVILYAISFSAASHLRPETWYYFSLQSFLCFSTVVIILWFIGFRKEQRFFVLSKINGIRKLNKFC